MFIGYGTMFLSHFVDFIFHFLAIQTNMLFKGEYMYCTYVLSIIVFSIFNKCHHAFTLFRLLVVPLLCSGLHAFELLNFINPCFGFKFNYHYIRRIVMTQIYYIHLGGSFGVIEASNNV